MAGYLLDTNFLIDAVFTKRSVDQRRLQSLQQYSFAISIISIGELYEGAYHRVNPDVSVEAIRQAISDFKVLNLTLITRNVSDFEGITDLRVTWL